MQRGRNRRFPVSDEEFERLIMREMGVEGMIPEKSDGVSQYRAVPNRVSGAEHPPLSDDAYERRLMERGELTAGERRQISARRERPFALPDEAYARVQAAEDAGMGRETLEYLMRNHGPLVPGQRSALDGGTLYAAAANVRPDAGGGAQAPQQAGNAQNATAREANANAAQAPAAQVEGNGDRAAPLGIRNNNPGNLRPLGRNDQWQGQVGTHRQQNGQEFSIFDTPENGLRALGINTISRQVLRNNNTVREIIGSHAPAADGNPVDAYARQVARSLGVSPDDPIDTQDPETLRGLMRAIIRHENGPQYEARYTDEQINDAVNTAIEHHRNRRNQR